ncbi:DMT family transporter [Streptococcus sp. S784/96/1]|uniref:DMT family transporter n=1 Tax=Streptococcus sp. S784/96/1 TaxID=2653499 RepID=UPI00138A0342|nr:DMT family transporter [Streptococcus sp. S784/96/1]
MQKRVKGTIQGLLSGVFWGLDTSLNGYILLLTPFLLMDKRFIPPTLLIGFFHDAISAVALLLYNKIKFNFTIKKLLSIRSTYFVMLAAIFAGPVGMQSYLISVKMLGAGVSATFSAIYPAVAAFFGMLFLKDRLTSKGWLGLSLSILSVAILSFSNVETVKFSYLGYLFAILCVLGWAFESVICSYGMNEDIQPYEALFIRQITSSFVYLILLFLNGNFLFSLQQIFSVNVFILIFLIAIVGTTSYMFYYNAIHLIGPVRATGLNVTYSIWAVVFSIILLNGTFDIKLIICGLMIIVGSILVSKA